MICSTFIQATVCSEDASRIEAESPSLSVNRDSIRTTLDRLLMISGATQVLSEVLFLVHFRVGFNWKSCPFRFVVKRTLLLFRRASRPRNIGPICLFQPSALLDHFEVEFGAITSFAPKTARPVFVGPTRHKVLLWHVLFKGWVSVYIENLRSQTLILKHWQGCKCNTRPTTALFSHCNGSLRPINFLECAQFTSLIFFGALRCSTSLRCFFFFFDLSDPLTCFIQSSCKFLLCFGRGLVMIKESQTVFLWI